MTRIITLLAACCASWKRRRGEEPCLPASDDTDYTGESVSANVSPTLSIPPPFGGCSLQFPSASKDVFSLREDIQDAQDHQDVGVITRNQRNQSMSATLQAGDHFEQCSPNCTDYADYSDDIDYGDYADYANESVSAHWSQIHEPDSPPTGSSLQHLSEAGDLLTEQEDLQGAQDHRVDYADGVITRNQRNQSMSATTQASDHVGQSSPKWIDYVDYTDYSDGTDYVDYANESVSAYWSQTHEPDPPPTGASLKHPAAAGDLLSQREDVQDDRDVDVINRNQCNQSMSKITQAGDHVEQCFSTLSDYSDFVDYADDSVSANISHSHKPPPPADASLQPSSAPEKLFSQSEDMQDAQDYRDVADISVINRNHRNQSELQCLEATLQVERSEGDIALDPNDASPGKARASPVAPGKKRCPHHPHARWIRFDPSGQAWCDRMDCWDCYRLMKIGEALDYRPLSEYTRGIVTLKQGIKAWSSFVTSQGSFAVLTATQYAIDICKALGVEVPDLSGEVQRLVSARE